MGDALTVVLAVLGLAAMITAAAVVARSGADRDLGSPDVHPDNFYPNDPDPPDRAA